MDLRDRRDWRPLTGVLHFGPWDITVWAEPRLPGENTSDPWVVTSRAGRLRLGVTDAAATNPALTEQDVAWSAQVPLAALSAYDDLEDAVQAAAARMHDPNLVPRLANPCAQLAAVDLGAHTSAVHAVRAGDCEVWVRPRNQQWEPLLASARLKPAAAKAFAAHPGARSADRAMHFAAHVDTLDNPAAWLTAPVGLDYPALTQQASVEHADEVIVASDGARLNAERCGKLQEWLSGGLQVGSPAAGHPSPHGDVTVLHARRAR